MIIENREYTPLKNNDFFVGTIGYEPRSLFLLEKNKKSRSKENTMLFCLDKKHYIEGVPSLYDELSGKGIITIDCQYDSGQYVTAKVYEFFSQVPINSNLHIDYSSMPRGWYCRLPKVLSDICSENKELFFWYVPGEHISDNFPTAGVNSIYNNQERADPTEKTRYHIMGLGYDKYRSEAVYSLIEPENLVTCYSFSLKRSETKKYVTQQNIRLLSNSINVIDFPINDFASMIAKLRGLVSNYLQYGQVIIVPDGTKPLILAMSMMPDVIDERDARGLTCLFIERSKDCMYIEVGARQNEIYGFQLMNSL